MDKKKIYKIEKEIEIDAVTFYHQKGAVCLKGEQFGSCHWPDQIVLFFENAFWVEFKYKDRPLSPGQIAKFEMLEKKNQYVYCVNNINDAKQLILRPFFISNEKFIWSNHV